MLLSKEPIIPVDMNTPAYFICMTLVLFQWTEFRRDRIYTLYFLHVFISTAQGNKLVIGKSQCLQVDIGRIIRS